jgi:signal transduction histidine kinase/ActR/RegA family two-component response regulator
VARILVVDPGIEPGGGYGREWQTRLVALGHSVPRVSADAAALAADVADLSAEAVIALVSDGAAGAALLGALRRWRRVEGTVPLLLVAGPGWDWRWQKDGAGLHPFLVVDEATGFAGLPQVLSEWLPKGPAAEPAMRQALQVLGEAILVADLAGNVSFLNRSAEELTGWRTEEAQGLPVPEVFRPGEATPAGTALVRRDGAEVLVAGQAVPLEGEDGSLLGSVRVFRPVPASGEEAAEPGDLVTAMADPVIVIDATDRVTFVNEASRRFFCRSSDQILGEDFWGGMPPGMRERFEPVFAEVRREKMPAACECELPAEGEWVQFRIHALGEGLLLILRNVTEEKAAEKDRRRTERLEALEHLARGFSHGFNNLLTVILGNIALAESCSRDPVQKGMLQEAGQAGRKAQGLVQQIMVFARGGVPIKGLLPIAPLLRQMVKERQAEHPGLVYRLDLEGMEIVVRADAKQLRRLLENLLLNAEQASTADGVIGVAGRSENAADGSAWLVIEVSDAGAGMEPEVLRQAFEPFFSTRQPLNATGLGLTVCESIARAHGGTVWLKSAPGEGTVVTVRIPLAQATGAGPRVEPFRNGMIPFLSQTPQAQPQSQPQAGARGGARILVLEDESLIRRLIHTTLTQAGHRVDESREGQSAVKAYQQAALSGDPYDLLIMDLTIEDGMGGVEAMDCIRRFDPRACAIVSSGYNDDPAMADPQRFGFSAVLPKPYQPLELVDAVEAMLRGLRQERGSAGA